LRDKKWNAQVIKVQPGYIYATKGGDEVEVLSIMESNFAPVLGKIGTTYGRWWPDGRYAIFIQDDLEMMRLVRQVPKDKKR
jgi:hypothetical protein